MRGEAVMKSEGFRAFVEELFEPVAGASVRPMFGGLGIFKEGTMFALAADEVLYFRVDAENEPAFVAEGSEAWVYEGRDRAVTMPYWRVPERLLDDREEFRSWALAAFASAQRAKGSKPKPRPRPKRSEGNLAKKPPAATKPKTLASRGGAKDRERR
jgi:DNA transformation protein